MRTFSIIATLVAFFVASASSQQYAGEVINTTLPNVPGSEICFFNIPRKGTQKHTLINYYSRGKDGKRLVESKVQRAVIIVHGLNRDPGTYQSNMMSALAQVTGDTNINKDTVAIMSPYFPNGDDKGTGYPWTEGLAPGRGSTTSALVWKSSQWSAGGDNQYPWNSKTTSSYMVLDTIIKYFDDKTLFPNMKQIVIAGHSLGAQTVQRYAALGDKLNTKSPVTYWIGNPNSYVWLSTDRPLSTASCPTYDEYREGYSQFTEYPMTYGQSLVSQGRTAILANYQSKQIAYARGTKDNGDDSSTCAPMTTGSNRNERFFNFIKAFPASCDNPSGANCDTVDFVNMGHDGGGMFASAAGKARLFTDNFYGDGKRSYDFGYPRQQAGDDPFPDPALNTTTASVDNNTYAGNMTYAGCWSDSGQSRTFSVQAYEKQDNTIDQCTSTCASRGFSMAGVEFGSQCYCGNAMTSGAVKVIESSCKTPCAGNSSQSCGGTSRLSVFSNGPPTVLAPASNPETVGNFYYSNCYTDTGNPRTLAGQVSRGNFVTLDYCANFCSAYKYFGTEYGTECFCGNNIDPAGTIASTAECGMTCANDTSQFCGGRSRLSLYTNPDWVQPTGSSTSSAASNPTASGASGPSCPASDNTVVTAKNGQSFTIECGIDHAGGDLAMQYVSSFQECIDACSTNTQCLDVSLSGSACYLKKSVGAIQKNAGVWGAKLLVDGSSTTSTASSNSGSSTSISVSSTALSASTASQSSTGTSVSSSSATSSPTAISCPASDGNTYTGASGQSFVIECGIDHLAGDMGNKYVNSFQECIDVCDQTAGCVDVSLSGTACYLKKSLGAAVKAPSIWGAKLVVSSSTSSTQSQTANPTDSSSASSSSISSSSTSTDSSSTSSSSSSSGPTATSSVVACPDYNGTVYTVASGKSFLIECGIDHQGGDLTSKSVKSFTECISFCDSTLNCVDVSMSGDMCYLKSSVGPVLNYSWIWGAKLIETSSSSSSSSPDTTTSASSTSSGATYLSTTSSSTSSTSLESSISSVSSSSTSELSTSELSTSELSTTSTSSSLISSTTTESLSESTSTESSLSTSSSSSILTVSSDPVSTSTSSESESQTSSTIETSSSTVSESSDSTTSASATSDASVSSSTSSTKQIESGTSATETSSSSSAESSSSILSSTETTSSTVSEASESATSITSDDSLSSSTTSSTELTQSTASSSTASSSESTESSTTSAVSSSTSSASSTESTESSTSSSSISSSSSLSSSSSSIETSSSTVSEPTTSSSTSIPSSSSIEVSSSTVSESTTSSSTSATSSLTGSTSSSLSSSVSSSSSTSSGFITSTSSTTSSAPASTSTASLPAGFSYAGCFIDGSKRVLPVSAGTSSTQTQQQCAMTCQTQGYKYSGTEYGNECWCGNTLPTSSTTDSQCSKACAGDKNQKCGAGNRLTVISDDSWKQTFFARENFESWNLLGCYTDSTSKRSLPSSVSLAAYGGGSKASISNCMQACQARGFAYCGAEYYSECFGSNSPPATSLASGSDPLSAGCNFPCKGNTTESCGGSARIIVYTTVVDKA